MATTEQITLYSAKICPWAHRVELALQESGLTYDRFEIDLSNKPEWYAPKVNPASKVPAISYGGPKVDPSTPDPSSFKLAESYVLLEFFADLTSNAGSSNLLPSSPTERAKARFFIETVSAKLPPTWYAVSGRGQDPHTILGPLEVLQSLLPTDGPYALGKDWSIADAAITPFIARVLVALENDYGAYDKGKGREVFEILQNDEKWERLRKYWKDVSERESFKKTFDKEYIKTNYATKWESVRAQRQAEQGKSSA